MFVDDGGHFCSNAACARRLVHNYSAARLFNRGYYCLFVKRPDGAEVDDLDTRSELLLRLPGRLQRDLHHGPVGEDAHICALLQRFCLAKWNEVVILRRVLAERTIQFDVLKEEHRVRIGNGRGKQAFCIRWRRRHNYFQTRSLQKYAFKAIRVEFGSAYSTAIRRTYDQRTGERASTAKTDTRRLRHQLVHAHKQEARELYLCHRPQSINGHADGAADDGRF